MIPIKYTISIITFVLVVASITFMLSHVYYNKLPDDIRINDVDIISEIKIDKGSLQQGILWSAPFFFSSNHPMLYKFDSEFNLIASKRINIPGINKPHIGILSKKRNEIWGGVIDLDAYMQGESNTRLVKFNKQTLEIIKIYDFSKYSRYIDAIAIRGSNIWYSYHGFIHKLKFDDQNNVLRLINSYRVSTGTVQGMRILEDKIFIIGENNTMKSKGYPDGIYSYHINDLKPYTKNMYNDLFSRLDEIVAAICYKTGLSIFNFRFTKQINEPTDVWPFGYPVGRVDNEGFSFVSEK